MGSDGAALTDQTRGVAEEPHRAVLPSNMGSASGFELPLRSLTSLQTSVPTRADHARVLPGTCCSGCAEDLRDRVTVPHTSEHGPHRSDLRQPRCSSTKTSEVSRPPPPACCAASRLTWINTRHAEAAYVSITSEEGMAVTRFNDPMSSESIKWRSWQL